MSRVVSVLMFVLFGQVAVAADLPPGVLVRLGDDRFRPGGSVDGFALSPDGKKYATVQIVGEDVLALTVWDAATGHPLREQRLPERVVDLVGAGVGEILALEEDAGATERGAQAPGFVERRGASDVVAQQLAELRYTFIDETANPAYRMFLG